MASHRAADGLWSADDCWVTERESAAEINAAVILPKIDSFPSIEFGQVHIEQPISRLRDSYSQQIGYSNRSERGCLAKTERTLICVA